jgi:hypothetical protein
MSVAIERPGTWTAFGACLTIASASFAHADDVPGSPASSPARSSILPSGSAYEFSLVPGVWVPRLGGDVSLTPGGGGGPPAESINLEFDLNLDSSEATVNVELSMRKNEVFQLDLSGFDFETSESRVFEGFADFGALSLDPGDPYLAEFDMTSLAVEFAWWCFRPRIPHTRREGASGAVDLRLAPAVGVRYLDVDQVLEVSGEGRESAGGEWLIPFIAIQLQMRYELPREFPLIHMIQIDGGIGLGPALGGDGGTGSHVRAGMTAYVTPNLGLTFGYRLIDVDVESDGYAFNGGLQGLFFAGTIRF